MVIRINYNNLYFHTSYTIPARYPLNPGARAATTQSIRDHPVTALRCKDTYVGALTYPYNQATTGLGKIDLSQSNQWSSNKRYLFYLKHPYHTQSTMWRTVLVGYSQFLQLFFLPAHSWESHTGPPQTAITQSHHTGSANEVVTQGHHTRPSHSWITQSHQTGSSHRIIIQCHHILTQDRHKESAHRGITQDHHKRSSQTIIPQGHQIWSHRIITKGQHTESSHTVITKSHHKGSSNRGHWEDKFCCVCETKPVGNLIGRYRLDQITIFVAQFFGRI